MITLRLAVRDWDYLTPLILNDIKSDKFNLELVRVNTLPDHLSNVENYDGMEMSFSRYALSRAEDNHSDIIGIPYFLMRAFRHRCIITRQDSPLKTIHDLKGKRIGLTGWQDSGNIWTRAILRREGINIKDNQWYLSRLSADQVTLTNRGFPFVNNDYIYEVKDEVPLIDLLETGQLDAIFTAFMPTGFYCRSSSLRHLLPNFVQDEQHYFDQVHYVPGIHIIGIKKQVVEANPWIVNELCSLLDGSKELWQQKCEKYADTSPWLIEELGRAHKLLPSNWNKNSFLNNRQMIADFAHELFQQDLTKERLTPEQLFPYFKPNY
jgi:4,5-dihydroxyphthalate decarboxylase